MTRAERDCILSAWDASVAAYRVGWFNASLTALLALEKNIGVRLAMPSTVARGGTR